MTDRVQRRLVRAWRDRTVGGDWKRRVRWYEFRSDEGVSIRLNFCERFKQYDPRSRWIEVNCFYDNDAEAEKDVKRFQDGERALTIRNERDV